MKIIIAGYNVDTSFLKDIKEGKIITPETISAAYARISRSAKSIPELREIAISEVEKARNSNKTIIFDMGHSSIAEHAVFNMDILGISRFLAEFIEKSRLASFTEKSQRYVTLKGDFVIPKEIEDNKLGKQFFDLIREQNELYKKLYERLKEINREKFPTLKKRDLEGRSKEDARYVLALATETQIGMTINARSLARLLKRLDALDLIEAKMLKKLIEDKVKKIAPSIIRYTDADNFERNYKEKLPKMDFEPIKESVKLVDFKEYGDDFILASLLFEKYGYDFEDILQKVRALSQLKKNEIFDDIFSDMKPYDVVPRAFETIDYLFQLKISASCFAQLKRHRMASVIRSYHNKDAEFVLPLSFLETGLLNEVNDVMRQTSELFFKLRKENELLANYVLTNAHTVNVLFKMNLRELYHFARLRCDKHSQWEIREIARKMVKEVKRVTPIAAKCLMGKDEFITRRSEKV